MLFFARLFRICFLFSGTRGNNPNKVVFQGDSPQAQEFAAQLQNKLNELKDIMSKALTDKVNYIVLLKNKLDCVNSIKVELSTVL